MHVTQWIIHNMDTLFCPSYFKNLSFAADHDNNVLQSCINTARVRMKAFNILPLIKKADLVAGSVMNTILKAGVAQIEQFLSASRYSSSTYQLVSCSLCTIFKV